MNQEEAYMAPRIRTDVTGLTADDVEVRQIAQSTGVVVALGDVTLYFPDFDAAHEVWVDVGRKLAHLAVEHYVDQAAADAGDEP